MCLKSESDSRPENSLFSTLWSSMWIRLSSSRQSGPTDLVPASKIDVINAWVWMGKIASRRAPENHWMRRASTHQYRSPGIKICHLAVTTRVRLLWQTLPGGNYICIGTQQPVSHPDTSTRSRVSWHHSNGCACVRERARAIPLDNNFRENVLCFAFMSFLI